MRARAAAGPPRSSRGRRTTPQYRGREPRTAASRLLPLVALAFAVLAPARPTRAQARATPSDADSARVARVRSELRTLVAEANAALRRRDRAALERLYAPEYVWVHASGYANDLKTHLDEELAVDSITPLPITLEAPEELRVYGDVAVLRRPFRSGGGMWAGRPALSTWIFARRDGRWRIVQQQATMFQPERPVARVADSLLDAYAGDYGESGRVRTRVRRVAAELVSRGVPALDPPRVMRPTSDSTFFNKIGAEYLFERAADGRVVALVIVFPDGRRVRRERIAAP